MKTLLICMTSLALLSACSTGVIAPVESRVGPGASTRPGGNTGPNGGNPIGGNTLGVGDATRPITPVNAAGPNGGANDPAGLNGTQVGKSIFFDYNEFTVKADSQDMLRQNFGTQRTRDTAPIRLEGNADERGSAEYNLALGQKRAEAVKKQLQILGMPEGQLEAVSYGSEKPRETCREERCWAANRRVDIKRLGR